MILSNTFEKAYIPLLTTPERSNFLQCVSELIDQKAKDNDSDTFPKKILNTFSTPNYKETLIYEMTLINITKLPPPLQFEILKACDTFQSYLVARMCCHDEAIQLHAISKLKDKKIQPDFSPSIVSLEKIFTDLTNKWTLSEMKEAITFYQNEKGAILEDIPIFEKAVVAFSRKMGKVTKYSSKIHSVALFTVVIFTIFLLCIQIKVFKEVYGNEIPLMNLLFYDIFFLELTVNVTICHALLEFSKNTIAFLNDKADTLELYRIKKQPELAKILFVQEIESLKAKISKKEAISLS